VDRTARARSRIVRQVTLAPGSSSILTGNRHQRTRGRWCVRVQVVLSASSEDDTPTRSLGGATRTFDARIVGAVKTSNLAVLKIDTAKPRGAVRWRLRLGAQGHIVFALGSPGGLRTRLDGCRQHRGSPAGILTANGLHPDDAAINPGNSGGPLVNVAGELVASTRSSSASRAAPGLGFRFRVRGGCGVPDIRSTDNCSVMTRRQRAGSDAALASGLGLPRRVGVMVPTS